MSFHTFIRPLYKLRKYPPELAREYFDAMTPYHTIKSISYGQYDIFDVELASEIKFNRWTYPKESTDMKWTIMI